MLSLGLGICTQPLFNFLLFKILKTFYLNLNSMIRRSFVFLLFTFKQVKTVIKFRVTKKVEKKYSWSLLF